VAEIRARVVVADNDVLLREGLASLLTGSGFEVVGRSGNLPNCWLSSANTDRIW
jgi:DNA-binding NarL/FixJ family response regulator